MTPCVGPTRSEVLLVSKPVAPPWNDSSKNLVRDLARAGERYRYRVLTPRGVELPGLRVVSDPIYPGLGAHTPALAQNARVAARLLRRDAAALTHFFFAPNPRSSAVARLALRLRPRRAVQTVCSVPREMTSAPRLLFAERVVALSRHTRDALAAAGVPASRLVHIPPGIVPPAPLSPARRRAVRARHGLPQDRPVVIFAGDYQFSRAADTVARAIAARPDARWHWVLACRIKQEASRAEERRIRDLLAAAGVLSRVTMLNQVPEMLDLLGACDLCALPAESLYAKMDLPLVLLEAMALGLPIVVADRPPLVELLDDPVGVAVPPVDPEALAAAVEGLLGDPTRRRAMADAGRRAVATRYHAREMARRHERLYDALLAGERSTVTTGESHG